MLTRGCKPPRAGKLRRAVFEELMQAVRYAPCGPWDFTEVCACLCVCVPREEAEKSVSSAFLGGQVGLETRPRHYFGGKERHRPQLSLNRVSQPSCCHGYWLEEAGRTWLSRAVVSCSLSLLRAHTHTHTHTGRNNKPRLSGVCLCLFKCIGGGLARKNNTGPKLSNQVYPIHIRAKVSCNHETCTLNNIIHTLHSFHNVQLQEYYRHSAKTLLCLCFFRMWEAYFLTGV